MSTRGISKDEIKRRAQVRADKAEQRRIDAARALDTQQKSRKDELEKTRRLRELRLAKEAASTIASEQPKKPDAGNAKTEKKSPRKAKV